MSHNATVLIKKVGDHHLKPPTYHSDGASGFDLQSAMDRAVEIGPGSHYDFPVGFAFEVPPGYELQIRPRSGLAFKYQVVGLFGTIDSDFRGEPRVYLMNMGRRSYVVAPEERIGQAVLVPVTRASLVVVDELSKTGRAERGFGSTGK